MAYSKVICSISCVFVSLVAAVEGLSIPENDSPASSVDKNALLVVQAEVGWQSIFWGLFFLALNAMTVPSVFDIQVLSTDSDSLLFPMRISPFLCLADVLDVLVIFVILVVLKGETIRVAASAYQSRFKRVPMSPVVGAPLELAAASSLRKHPFIFLMVFLGTATQAVKIFGFEGPQFWWIKAMAGIYVASYVMLVGAFFLPRTPPAIPLFRSTKEVDTRSFYEKSQYDHFSIALVLQAACASYATSSVIHNQLPRTWEFGSCQSTHGMGYMFCCLASVFFYLGFLVLPVVTIACVALAFWIIGKNVLRLRDELEMSSIDDSVTWYKVLGGCVIFFLFFYVVVLVMPPVLEDLTEVVVQGCLPIVLGVVGLFGLNVTAAWGMKRVIGPKRRIRALSGEEFWVASFVSVNLLIACLYCCYVYDPKGTVKPAWAEKLG